MFWLYLWIFIFQFLFSIPFLALHLFQVDVNGLLNMGKKSRKIENPHIFFAWTYTQWNPLRVWSSLLPETYFHVLSCTWSRQKLLLGLFFFSYAPTKSFHFWFTHFFYAYIFWVKILTSNVPFSFFYILILVLLKPKQ